MRKKYIFNKKLNEIYKFETNQLLKKKINKAKSLLNLKCPESYSSAQKQNLRNKFIKKQSK